MVRSTDLWYMYVIFSVCVVRGTNHTTVGYEEKNDQAIVTECKTPNRDTGYCIRIKQCNILLKQLNNTEATTFLRASQCGPSNDNILNPKVCCGKYDNFRIVKENTIFPKSCGRQDMIFAQRILGGKEADLGEFPWMARLMQQNENGVKTTGCSGFLINNRHVLTAAHCTHPYHIKHNKIISVVLGEHNTETNPDCSPDGKDCVARHIRRVVKVITHPDYDPQNSAHYNDIAIIQLKSGVRRSKFVQPICILRNDTRIPTRYYLSGWGKTEKELFSKVKMKVEVPPFNKAKCKKKFSLINVVPRDTQICAGGEEGKDSCGGDSGGPLMMVSDNETWYASGVVSYGINCGMKGWPGVYTNVLKFLPWIRSEMTKNMLDLAKRRKVP